MTPPHLLSFRPTVCGIAIWDRLVDAVDSVVRVAVGRAVVEKQHLELLEVCDVPGSKRVFAAEFAEGEEAQFLGYLGVAVQSGEEFEELR